MHPKAEQARIAAETRRAARAIDIATIKQAKKDLSVRFLSIGRHTACYHLEHDVLTFSTAIRHTTDRNDRVIGEATALNRYINGASVQIRLGNMYRTPKLALQNALGMLSAKTSPYVRVTY